MKEKQNINRRNFLKTMGAAGFGSVLASSQLNAAEEKSTKSESAEGIQQPKMPQVPRRKLGKTGVEVPILALGMIFNAVDKQIILRKALDWGVTYWDTADCYNGGNSELGVGKFLTAQPEKRKDLFIVSKSDDRDPAGMQKLLDRSLERMNTDYIDMYFIHIVEDPDDLTEEVKAWVEKTKKAKKIRFFGFSTHENMPECLNAAAECDWIDAVMTSYNFRLMQDPDMQDALEACYKAGVGLVAMKTQAEEVETEDDKKLTEHFLKRGFTEGQAKVKAVLADKRITAACVGRDNLAHLTENIAAVLDKTELSLADMDVFKQYARQTCSGYCAGCSNICHPVLPDMPYVSKIMRYLMYYNSYSEQEEARRLFAKIPASARNKLLSTDYRTAEVRCPQNMPIGKLMAEAVTKLA
ncbi:aldo/keto reductase [Planctomycetota bacterium]